MKSVRCPCSALCYYYNYYISIYISLNLFYKSGEEEGVRRTDSFQSTAGAGSTFQKHTCHAHTSLLPPIFQGTKGKEFADFSHVYLPFSCLNFEHTRSQSPAHHCIRGMAFFVVVFMFVSFATGNVNVLAVGKENP